MRKFYRLGLSVAAGLLAFACSASLAVAQTVTTTATSVDFSSVIASVENVVFGVAAGGFAWIAHRAVTAIENYTGTQLTVLHGNLLNAAITEALGLARNKLDAALQGKETVDVHNQLAATAAQLVVTKIPDTLTALGISQAAVLDKIKGLLGISLSPIQTISTPAPAQVADPAPTLDLATIIAAVKAAVMPQASGGLATDATGGPATPPAPAVAQAA